MAGKKGSTKGEPLKQGGALAKINDWIGSMSLMNTLYVGSLLVGAHLLSRPSASATRGGCNATNPIHRDPTMFNSLEVQNGTASRDMRYKIQK